MCHGSDVLPGQSAISDSDLLLDSTFCEKTNKQVSQFFGTMCLLSSGMDHMSHSASQRFRIQIYCWTVPSVKKNKQVSHCFGTVCLLSSPTGMDQMSHSASQRFRTQIYCWTVPSVKKNRFPSFFCTVDLLFSAGAMDPDVSPCSKLSDFGEEKTNKTKRGMHV